MLDIKGEWGPRIPDPDETRELDESVRHSIQNAHDFTRDKLAEKFAVGLLASGNQDVLDQKLADLITDAYAYADAMLAYRKKEKSDG